MRLIDHLRAWFGTRITRPAARAYRPIPKSASRRRPAVISIRSGLISALAGIGLLLGSTAAAYAATNTAPSPPHILVDPITSNAAPNGILMYKIQVHNDNAGSEDLSRVDVTLRYDPNTIMVIDSKLRDSHDWVSDVDNGKVTLQFGKIDQDNERSATLIFRVNGAVAIGSPILADASFQWWTAGVKGTGGLTIDNVIAVSPVSLAPDFIAPNGGPAGTLFQLGGAGFTDEETVVTWLNTPSSVQGLSLSGVAGDDGQVQLQFDSTGLAPGYYSLVMHGLESRHEVVLPFIVAGA